MEITELITYSFFIKALLAGLFASVSCAFIGTYIVSRKIVFISGGISHASFGGIGMGYFFGLDPVFSATCFAVCSAIFIQFVSDKFEVNYDSLIGIIWSLGMAIGIIFIYLTPGYAPNLMSYLFGDILTVSSTDLISLSSLNIIIFITFYFFYREIKYVSFDEDFMISKGVNTSLLSYLMIILTSLTIVFNIRVVGIILVISLLTIPQAIAGIFTFKYKNIILLSTIFGSLSCVMGLLISSFYHIPSGASIIFTLTILFIILKTMSELILFYRKKSNLKEKL